MVIGGHISCIHITQQSDLFIDRIGFMDGMFTETIVLLFIQGEDPRCDGGSSQTSAAIFGTEGNSQIVIGTDSGASHGVIVLSLCSVNRRIGKYPQSFGIPIPG